MTSAKYFLVFGIANLGTRHSGGHSSHGVFSHREDAQAERDRLTRYDHENTYQVCEFAANVRDDMLFSLQPAS